MMIMRAMNFKVDGKLTSCYFGQAKSFLKELSGSNKIVLITDEHVYKAHPRLFYSWKTIVLKPGEKYKQQSTIDQVITQLIEMKADRQTMLVGIGGGVITDMTGYAASVYMRGIKFGFIPTSLLAMVDASLGGKNGVDVGLYKNLVGTIRQPEFLLYDVSLLKSLPKAEWENGFAEIIKHACIQDSAMFRQLEAADLITWQKKSVLLTDLIRRNVRIKMKIVMADPYEKSQRKWLNFGHTLGHALENMHELSHGKAISIGMTYASSVSMIYTGFRSVDRVIDLLSQYHLPCFAKFELKPVMDILEMDKKKQDGHINYVMLNKIGKPIIQPITTKELSQVFDRIQSNL